MRPEANNGHRVIWPLQYAYLLNSGLVSWPPPRSVDLIKDRSKANGLLKLHALWQAVWFTINCIVRRAHYLELALLESMTLAYIVQVVLTYCCWWKKPKDIATATFVKLPEMAAEQSRQFESLAMESTSDVPDPLTTQQSMSVAWYIIPRDCSENAYLIASAGSQDAGALADDPPQRLEAKQPRVLSSVDRSHRPIVQSGGSRPTNARVITEWDDSLYMTKWWLFVCLIAVSFGAVHLIS